MDCPRPLASLTNTYGGLVSTLGLCTTCTRWLVASTNKISTPYNKTTNNAGRYIFHHHLNCDGHHTLCTDHHTVVLQTSRVLPGLLPSGHSCLICWYTQHRLHTLPQNHSCHSSPVPQSGCPKPVVVAVLFGNYRKKQNVNTLHLRFSFTQFISKPLQPQHLNRNP